jgi:hypothetical protein
MAENKKSADHIHDLLNPYFNTRVNPNWKAIIESIGESDDEILDLIEQVRKQFFIATASRPYIDRLAANYKISRPKVVGMDDTTLRRYVPLLAYQPKQVKGVIDQLLDVFFFKESTTALTESSQFEPFYLENGWELEYTIDGINLEQIIFKAEDFADISNATADEIASAINRRAKYSFAISFENRITKRKFVKIFTKTIGSKGSIEITGGRADISLQFPGFIVGAGSGDTTEWLITKVGDTTRFQYFGGTPVGLGAVRVGDNVVIDIPGNSGTFKVININLNENYFEFNNLFSTPVVSSDTYLIAESSNDKWIISVNDIGQLISTQLSESDPRSATPWIFRRDDGTPVSMTVAEDGEVISLSPPGYSGITVEKFYLKSPSNNLFLLGVANSGEFYTTPETPSSLLGVFSHLLNPNSFVRFVRPERSVVYTRDNRSIVWEVRPGEIVIEMPSTPPVVRRQLKGSAHLNGIVSTVISSPSGTSLIVDNAEDWPNSGKFVLEKLEQIKTRIITLSQDTLESQDIDGNFDAFEQTYSYESKTLDMSGNYLISGISPPLPVAAGVVELSINSISCDTNGVVTVATTQPHGLKNGQTVQIYDVTGGNFNGIFEVTETIDELTFKTQTNGSTSVGAGGNIRIERVGLASSGSKLYLTTAIANAGITGPYMFDTAAPFVVSSYTGKIINEIKAGTVVFNLSVETPNSIPNEQGFLIFDYGLSTQEGPVRYLYKANEGSITLDPSYIFQYDHAPNSAIVAIRRKGAHVMSGLGKEYAFYASDPSAARVVLQKLIEEVKSAGVFLRYLIRYPSIYYSSFDIYSQTTDNLLD